MEKRYINPDNPVYISYAWAKTEHQDIEKDVDELCKILDNNDIYYKRDKDNLCPYRWSIQKAEEEIGEGAAIIVVISERYLKSLHCMNEWHLMRENGKIWERLFPIVLEDTNITDKETFRKYYKYFEERKQSLIKQQYEGIIPLTRAEIEAAKAGFYIYDLKKMYQYLADNNTLKSSVLREDNKIIIGNLIEFLQQITNNKTNNIKTEIGSSIPSFPVSIPKDLIRRDVEAEDLYNGIIKNRFFNLVGIGGCGKTSLAYLMMQKHRYDFNEIAYVVANNNIEDDFVEQINATLNLPYEVGESFMYKKLIESLEENYKSDKPNLLVLDINETTKEADNKKFIDELHNTINNWHVLILSREHFTKFNTKNLNDNQDGEFIKKLFLLKAGDKYNDFEDFEGLCKFIDYTPILAEQLGIYLNGLPKKSLAEIKNVFYGEYFREEDISEGVSAIDWHNKIVSFLEKLIDYNTYKPNAQKLLSYFILWQAEYIDYDVIKNLLKGVFASDDDYENAIVALYKRAILTKKNLPNGSTSYKLHGLLAESLREQINISKQDYSVYMNNIEKIIEYNYYEFIPYADCIGNSLCEYDITENEYLLCDVGNKFYNTQKTDYAKKLYEKYITIALKKINNHPNIYDYQNNLAIVYMNLAILQADHLNDYEQAEVNYKKSIIIREQLPIDNPDYQNNLARAYYNFAVLQTDNLNDYTSAETCYNKAIIIGEQLPKDNSEYQNDLALAYNGLASLQGLLKDYKSAETNYNKAIEIRKELSKNDQENQNLLANTYAGLAILQSDHLDDYQSAEINYKKAIEIHRKLAEENPYAFLPDVARTLSNLADLHLNTDNFDAAAKEYQEALEIRRSLAAKNPNAFLPEVARTLSNLADLHLNTDDFDAATMEYQEALMSYRQLADENPDAFLPNVATTLNNLASLHYNTHDYDLAAEEYRKVLEIRRQLAEKNPDAFLPDMAMTLNNIAAIIRNSHDYGVTAKGYQEALEIYRKLAQKNPDAFLTDVDKAQKTTSRLRSVLSEEITTQGIDQLKRIVDKLHETLQCLECSLWYVNSVNNSYYDLYDDSGSNTSTKSISLIHRKLVYDSVYEFNNTTDYVHIISECLLKKFIDWYCKSDVNSSVGYIHFTREEVADYHYLSINFLEYLDKDPLQYDFIVIPIASQKNATDIIAILEFCINSEYYRNYTENQWIEMVQTIQSVFTTAFKHYFEHDILIQQQKLLFDLIKLQDKHKNDTKEDLFEDVINIIREKYCPCQGASFFMWDSSEERYNLIHTTGLVEINNGKMRREDVYYMTGEGLTGKTGKDGELFIFDDLSEELKSLHKIKTCESVEGDDSIKTINHIKTGMFIPIAYPNKPKEVVGILRLINKTNQCNPRFVDYFNYKIDGIIMEMAAKYLSLVCDSYIKQDEQEVFISKMTHELNTPANAIHKSADLLYKNIDDEEFIKQNLKVFLGDIRDLAQMQKWQVATNLQLSKNRKKIPFNIRYNIHEYNLYELILSSKNITKTITSNYGVPFENIHIDYGLNNFRIRVDKNAFITIFYNILTNAIKYNDPNNEFYINVTGYITTDNNEVIRIIVEDHGIGINKKEETAIFEIGYRGENAIKQNAHGYGIGLPVIKQIINDFGGKIYISNYKNPTKFIIDLPKKILL